LNYAIDGKRWRPAQRFGLGGIAIANAFGQTLSESQATELMKAAWDSGVRMYDTSPFYGLGRSERRMGELLSSKPREQFVIFTTVGRVLEPDNTKQLSKFLLWENVPPFKHVTDYTADGVRRSVEQSLQRLGLSHIDIVYVHDLGPSNPELGERWRDQFEVARRGAFPALSKMRDEGIIKGWGLGVNEPAPIAAALDSSDPDILMAASQYTLVNHSDALKDIIPAATRHGAWIACATPLATGLLAGKPRYRSRPNIPSDIQRKYAAMQAVAKRHNVDLRVAALQFVNAQPVVATSIAGASSAQQVRQNVGAFTTSIPNDFWAELRHDTLIDPLAPVPA
jgi:D-threo-aldose 1-dehydrogenase